MAVNSYLGFWSRSWSENWCLRNKNSNKRLWIWGLLYSKVETQMNLNRCSSGMNCQVHCHCCCEGTWCAQEKGTHPPRKEGPLWILCSSDQTTLLLYALETCLPGAGGQGPRTQEWPYRGDQVGNVPPAKVMQGKSRSSWEVLFCSSTQTSGEEKLTTSIPHSCRSGH